MPYENFDAFVVYNLKGGSQTWTVEYYDADGHRIVEPLATADGGSGESHPIIAKIGMPVVALGDVQILG